MEATSDVAVVGAGVVGSRDRRWRWRAAASSVALLEAEPAPGLAASGTNSGILHTGFDSPPGELETRADPARRRELRDPVLEALGLPVAALRRRAAPRDDAERAAVQELAANARAQRGPGGRWESTARSRCPARRSPIRSPTRAALVAAAQRQWRRAADVV